MSASPSLFARELRGWRARHGAHGRMTQEQLAERLEVSVDAISKYERSVSFIRGDLEHRLADNLGWTRDVIRACREDWVARQSPQPQSRYQCLDDGLVAQLFNGSWPAAIRSLIKMVDQELGEMPAEFEPSEAVFLPIYDAYRTHWAAVMHKGEFVAKWAMIFLCPEDKARFKAGRLAETELTLESVHRPILPGTYYGYCPIVVIKAGHEAAGSILLTSFVRFLESLAARDILFDGIGTIACSRGGRQLCRDLGMSRLGAQLAHPDYEVWELSGAALANSIFTRRSPSLRRSYMRAFQD